jgi:hypothetical protein
MIDTDVQANRLIADRSHLRSLRFYAIGDFGSGDEGQALVADAMAAIAAREAPEFILGTGDSLYPAEGPGSVGCPSTATVLGERFDPYYDRLGVDFFQAAGNEDLLSVFGCDSAPMIAHTWRSATWRMPALSYDVPKLPPWISIHVANTNVFGIASNVAEKATFSEALMEREIAAIARCFQHQNGLKILVGHHPIFTPGKRTFRHSMNGELTYMRRLRRVLEDCGVHFYFSGHEHQQSHITGPACEHIIQGCGGARVKPNRLQPRREEGWRDEEKALRYFQVIGGFAVVDVSAAYDVRLRFFGIPHGKLAQEVDVVYEHHWHGLKEIGDSKLRECPLDDGDVTNQAM